MIKKSFIVALVLAIAMSGWLAYYFSAKEVIKRQLTGLAVELGKEEQESPLQMARKMGKIKKMLEKDCLVTIPEMGYSEVLEQDLIIHYLIYHRNRFALLTAAFEDVIIDIPLKGQATVQSTVSLRHQNMAQTGFIEESHQVEIALVKSDKKWLFHKVTMPEALVE